MSYFTYSEKEINYLKEKDKKLAEAIDAIGMIEREVNPDIFGSLLYNIVGQQISTAALNTVWGRFAEIVNHDITPENILSYTDDVLQSCGISYKKVTYMKKLSQKIVDGTFDIDALKQMNDEDAITYLSSLDGIGKWTAEMILIFAMERPNVVSYGDYAIQKGMRMLYHHRQIDQKKFMKYKRRYAPYGTVASLYLWEIASGAIPGMKDYKKKGKK